MDVDDWPLTGDCGDTVRSDPLGHRLVQYIGVATNSALAMLGNLIGVPIKPLDEYAIADALGVDPALPFWGGTP